ncbi:MAG: hypothetical protein LBR74_00695 [Eubacterium sp.]|jgi:hypothetical protein|nr:hypothetical protein [Eubacterium sp.]
MTKNTGKEEKIISALLECNSLAEVSAKTGIPSRTLYTLLQDRTFKQKLNTAKSNMLSQAVAKLNNYTALCVDILAEIAQDNEQNGQIRVSACKAVLDTAGRLNEQTDITSRIEELEQFQAENSRN